MFGDRPTGFQWNSGRALSSRGARSVSGRQRGDECHLAFNPPSQAHHPTCAAVDADGACEKPAGQSDDSAGGTLSGTGTKHDREIEDIPGDLVKILTYMDKLSARDMLSGGQWGVLMFRRSAQFSESPGAVDSASWAIRSDYWETYRPTVRGRPKKFSYREPLILCGHAAHIRVDHGSLLIRNGFTHYPQKQEIVRLFPGDPNLPDRIVMLDGSGGLSFDALNWMAEQAIEFVRLNWRGEITNIAGNSGYGGNSKLIQVQKEIKGTKTEIEFARYLISEKIDASIKTLKLEIPKNEVRDFAISKLTQKYSEIRGLKGQFSISSLLGIEGGCAHIYFKAWHSLPIKWVGFTRKPIPDNWFEFSSRNMTWRKRAYNARHPLNAMLNYAYGISANEMRGRVVSMGLDPTIGIIHGNSTNKIPLVYDLIEPLRPAVDRAILRFVLSHTFQPGDFAINRFGACRLNPQMARIVTKQAIGVADGKPISEYLKRLRL
jgi:CRISPR-associated endonuclease Cas1